MHGNRVLRQICGAVALVVVVGPCCYSQTVNIWPGVAPGSEKWTQTEKTAENTPMGKVVFNVVTPTLTLYLPDKSTATGTGIIVAPGGSCIASAAQLPYAPSMFCVVAPAVGMCSFLSAQA